MVFKRNTLRNTRTFKQSTSINTSNINTGNINPVPQPVINKKRTTYKSGSGSGGWAVSDSIKGILDPLPQADAVYDTNAGYADGKFQAPDGGTYVSEGNAKFYPKEGETPYNPYGQHEKTKDMESKYTTTYGGHLDKVGWGGVITGAIGELVGNKHIFTPYDDPSHPNNYKEMGAAAEVANPNEQFWEDQGKQDKMNEKSPEFKFRDSLSISEMPVNPKLVNPVKNATNFGVVHFLRVGITGFQKIQTNGRKKDANPLQVRTGSKAMNTSH